MTKHFSTLISVLNKNVLIALFLLQITLLGCSKDEESEATPRMTLKAKLDGKPWEATGFLVRQNAADVNGEAHLLVSARSHTGQIGLQLYLYGVDQPGTYEMDNTDNPQREENVLEINGDPDGFSSFFGWGPATLHVTKVADKQYAGTFTASFYDVTRSKTMQITEGTFEVYEGVQGE